VVRRRVVEVPREMILSIGDKGSEVIVAGLSPVKGLIKQSYIRLIFNRAKPFEKLYLEVKYESILPTSAPPSSSTFPNFASNSFAFPPTISRSSLDQC